MALALALAFKIKLAKAKAKAKAIMTRRAKLFPNILHNNKRIYTNENRYTT